jgi:hypothetical protein
MGQGLGRGGGQRGGRRITTMLNLSTPGRE